MISKNANYIDAELFEKILTYGAVNLQANVKEINDLNVFPVPDGDTGINMYTTLIGGVERLKTVADETIEKKADALAEGMLLNARGNSGVILSQLFYGVAKGLLGLKVASITQFADALRNGVQYAYKAVVKPVEGTILTVARESVELTCLKLDENTTIEEFFTEYLKELNFSLKKTPELLDVLKEANVVDSGGAGLVCIAEGFYKAIMGDESLSKISLNSIEQKNTKSDVTFDQKSKMDYGYCTEALVQLLDSKNGVENFDANAFIDFLTEVGDSVVAVQTGTKVKVHVHTMKPSLVLEECQKYGEFISVKIENMTLQNQEVESAKPKSEKRIKTAVVAVASGAGIAEIYKEYGADELVNGGQTDNPSTEEFIKAFDRVNAETIFVLPNNKNIVLSAKQAGELYTKSKVIVLPSKTPQQVYSALVVSAMRDDINALKNDMEQAILDVESYSITYAVRDAYINGIDIKEGDFMAFKDGDLMLSVQGELECLKETLKSIEDIDEKDILTIFYGKGVNKDLKIKVGEFVEENFPDIEFMELDGGQEVYPFLISLE